MNPETIQDLENLQLASLRPRDPIARAMAIVLARWNPVDLQGQVFRVNQIRPLVLVTGYSPKRINVHYKTLSRPSYCSWMNARQFAKWLR